MKIKKTILIFGVSSFIGSNLAEELKDEYRIIGTFHKTEVQISHALTMKCDVYDKKEIDKIIRTFKPDVVIYSVGLRNLSLCQEFPKLADAINTAGVFNVSQISEKHQAKFIYLSSSYVFSGEKDVLYKESDTPAPLNVYGNTVSSSEFFIQKSCLNYLIFRCAPVFGRSYHPEDKTFVEWIEFQSFKGEKINCDNRVKTGFLDILSLAKIVDLALKSQITSRLIQVTSPDIMTHYEFAKLYFKKTGKDESLLSPSDWKFPMSKHVITGRDLSEDLVFQMDSSNIINEFKVVLPVISEMIENYQNSLAKFRKRRIVKSSNIRFI